MNHKYVIFVNHIYKLLIYLILALLQPSTSFAGDSDELWLLVDTGKKNISVMHQRQVLHIYDSISIGEGGASLDKIQGDKKTPLGDYHVSRISYDSKFYLFIGLDYPDIAQAERALKAGIIDKKHYTSIRNSLRNKQPPPQHTPLGGYIGIHGVGKGDKQIHATVNWTNGCVALTDRQIDDLESWVYIGMRVAIR